MLLIGASVHSRKEQCPIGYDDNSCSSEHTYMKRDVWTGESHSFRRTDRDLSYLGEEEKRAHLKRVLDMDWTPPWRLHMLISVTFAKVPCQRMTLCPENRWSLEMFLSESFQRRIRPSKSPLHQTVKWTFQQSSRPHVLAVEAAEYAGKWKRAARSIAVSCFSRWEASNNRLTDISENTHRRRRGDSSRSSGETLPAKSWNNTKDVPAPWNISRRRYTVRLPVRGWEFFNLSSGLSSCVPPFRTRLSSCDARQGNNCFNSRS